MTTFVSTDSGAAINAASIASAVPSYDSGRSLVRLYDAAGECLGVFDGTVYELERQAEGPPALIPATPGYTRLACGICVNDGSEWDEALPLIAWRDDRGSLEPVVAMCLDDNPAVGEVRAVELPDGRVKDHDRIFATRAEWRAYALPRSSAEVERYQLRQAQDAQERAAKREADAKRPKLADLIRGHMTTTGEGAAAVATVHVVPSRRTSVGRALPDLLSPNERNHR